MGMIDIRKREENRQKKTWNTHILYDVVHYVSGNGFIVQHYFGPSNRLNPIPIKRTKKTTHRKLADTVFHRASIIFSWVVLLHTPMGKKEVDFALYLVSSSKYWNGNSIIALSRFGPHSFDEDGGGRLNISNQSTIQQNYSVLIFLFGYNPNTFNVFCARILWIKKLNVIKTKNNHKLLSWQSINAHCALREENEKRNM